MGETIFVITFMIWNPESSEYDEERSENFSSALPPLPSVGEEVQINVSEPGELVEYKSYTVTRRVFEYTTGPVMLHNMPRVTPLESAGVTLYVRPRTNAARVSDGREGLPAGGSEDPG
jgi:hypothetical protein